MKSMSRFTVSVPTALLGAVDQKLVTGKGAESRSALVRHLLEAALREAQEHQDIARYRQGYRAQPQTEEEFGWSDPTARERLAELPWREAR